MDVQVFEQVIILWKITELSNLAFGIFDVAEHNGLGRASLLTGRLDTVGRNRQISLDSRFDALRNLGGLDSLDTIISFLHPSTRTDRHVWIFLQLRDFFTFPCTQRP